MKAVYWLLIPLVLIAASADAADAEPIGVVVGLQGTAHAKAPDGKERVLALKSPIFMKDTVTTGPGAKLQVMFDDDSLYSQGEKSAVSIDEYVYNPARKEDNSFLMRILRGVSRIVTGGIADLNPDRFKVKTSRATIGIRGCELGFEVYDDFETILIIRVPRGRLIEVQTDMTRDFYRYRQPAWLRIGTQGVTERDLTPEDIRGLSSATTPTAGTGSGSSRTGAEEEGALDGSDTTTESSDGQTSDTSDSTEGVDSESTPIENAAATTTTETTDPVMTADNLRQDVIPNTTTDSTTPVPPPPPPPPPGPPPLRGGGVGAKYNFDGADYNLTDLIIYDHVIGGTIGGGKTSVDLGGYRIDSSGNQFPVQLSLRDIPLSVFGGTTFYEGYRERLVSPGVSIANDNLQQFVRRIDLNDRTMRMTFWGVPSAQYTTAPLPANTVVSYDAKLCAFPQQVAPPFPPEKDLLDVRVKVNTKTGIFAIEQPGGIIDYGRIQDLQLYGQFGQGVSAIKQDAMPSTTEPSKDGGAVAGFRIPADVAAESGSWAYRGYAAGWTEPQNALGTFRNMRSAYAIGPLPQDNEGRVRISLNKDAYQNNVSVNMGVYLDPATPSPDDLVLGQPTFSGYVDGNKFFARYETPEQNIEMKNMGSGAEWVWGEWNGERTLNPGTAAETKENTRGTYVAGRTIPQTVIAGLMAGTTVYNLHTPSATLGTAAAVVTRPGYVGMLNGWANLNVTLGGGAGNWSGTFNMTGPGASLNMTVPPTTILASDGHLKGFPNSYNLTINAVNYDVGTISQQEMTGSLVGPGTGSRPITGAIGSGHFVHNDGTTVNMTYGTDLVP